jgi:hypothetical protein
MPEVPHDLVAYAMNNLSAVLGNININLVELKKSLDRIAEKLDGPTLPTGKQS